MLDKKFPVVALAAGHGQAIASCILYPMIQTATEPRLSEVVVAEVILTYRRLLVVYLLDILISIVNEESVQEALRPLIPTRA